MSSYLSVIQFTLSLIFPPDLRSELPTTISLAAQEPEVVLPVTCARPKGLYFSVGTFISSSIAFMASAFCRALALLASILACSSGGISRGPGCAKSGASV